MAKLSALGVSGPSVACEKKDYVLLSHKTVNMFKILITKLFYVMVSFEVLVFKVTRLAISRH